MSVTGNGELVPVGGGDAIPLVRDVLTLGRRESCDIWLNFPNVSGQHCELSFTNGHWLVRDLGSTNGIKVNGIRVTKKALLPEDVITIAKRKFKIMYKPAFSQSMQEVLEDADDDMTDVPLMEKAGLEKPQGPKKPRKAAQPPPDEDDDD